MTVVHFPEFENAVIRSRAAVAEIDQETPVVFRQPDAMLDFKILHRRLEHWLVQSEAVRIGTEYVWLQPGGAKSPKTVTNGNKCLIHDSSDQRARSAAGRIR